LIAGSFALASPGPDPEDPWEEPEVFSGPLEDSPEAPEDPEEEEGLLLAAAFSVDFEGAGGVGEGSGVVSASGAGGGWGAGVEPEPAPPPVACATISFTGARADASAPTASGPVARPIKTPNPRKAAARAAHTSGEGNGSEPKRCSQRRNGSSFTSLLEPDAQDRGCQSALALLAPGS